MPSSVTHCFFSDDVYNKLEKKIAEKIKPCLTEYKIFSQGPDPYFFYDFHLTKRANEIQKINVALQHSHINEHFLFLVNYINQKNYYSNSMVMSYLYGQICHFALDTTCHPFIIYNTGIYKEGVSETYKYNGLHEEMEYYIDCYLIYKRKNILPKKYKAYKELFGKIKLNDELRDLIDNVTFDVYGFDNVSKKYFKSIRNMKYFYYIFNYDRFGIKKKVYKALDKICGDKLIRKQELSFNVDPMSKLFYLNNENQIWSHPCNKKESYNYSFFELYEIALVKAVNVINEIDKMLENKKIDDKRIKILFGNLDYGKGKDCDLNLDYTNFKF